MNKFAVLSAVVTFAFGAIAGHVISGPAASAALENQPAVSVADLMQNMMILQTQPSSDAI